MEHRDPGPDADGRPVTAVRAILNDWDPIGVIENGVPSDEYDCLIAPLLDHLAGGADAAAIAAVLRTELSDHFGMDPEHHEAGIESVSRGVVELRDNG